MALYQYKAVSEKGRRFVSTIDADSLQDAKGKLLRLRVAVFEIQQLKEREIQGKLSRGDVLNLTRELGRLLQAGIPLFESLSALEEKYRKQKPHQLLLNLCDQVKSGVSFSKSLTSHPESFDLLYTSMIANAEKTGRLAPALHELAELLFRQEQVRKQLVSALMYPAMLTGFCFVVLSSLLFYVIPSLKELFDGRDLHPFTKIVFAVSGFVCHFKVLILLFIGAVVGLVSAIPFSVGLKEKLAGLCFRLPYFKGLFAKIAFVRFGRAAATLLEGGLPLVQAFAGARKVMRHPELESVIERAEERISQGESICVPFQNHPLIPPLVPRMIGIAEDGGKLPFMMRQIAEIYEDELDKALKLFATVAQPVLLLVLGVIIGFVLLSVLLPLTDVSSFATN